MILSKLVDKRLVYYIQETLKKGYDINTIRDALLNKGFSVEEVCESIKYLKENKASQDNNVQQNNSKKIFLLIPVLLILVLGVFVFFLMFFSSNMISEEEFSQGLNMFLKENEEIKFNLGEVVHTIIVDSVGADSVGLTLRSDPISFNIGIGEEKKFDLDNDGFYNIKIRLNDIIEETPDLYIKKIYENTCVEDWVCESWNECTPEGIQIRDCNDVNNCNTIEDKPITNQECTFVEEIIVDSDDIEVDIIFPKDSYEIAEEIRGEYYLKYDGVPFKGAVIYCQDNSCSKTTGTFDDIDFDNPDKTNALNVELRKAFYEEGDFEFSIYVYACNDIDEVFNTDDCGSGGWPPTIDLKDIISSVDSLKSKSKVITVTTGIEEFIPECTNSDECEQTCENCEDGTYSCLLSSDPIKHQTCVECITSFSCVEGYTCENNVCVEEEPSYSDDSCSEHTFALPEGGNVNMNNINIKIISAEDDEELNLEINGVNGVVKKSNTEFINGFYIKNEGLQPNGLYKVSILCEEVEEVVEEETDIVTDPQTILDCYNEDLSEIICEPEKAQEFTDIFENRLGSCEISEGTLAMGFEPFMALFRGYEIMEEEDDTCIVKFWFLDNEIVDPSFIGKEMICEYDSSKRTINDMYDCLDDCCSGELLDVINEME